MVVVGKVAEEPEGQHVVAEVVRVHRPAQLVGDAPEGVAQLFLIRVSHEGGGQVKGAAATAGLALRQAILCQEIDQD